MPVEDKPVHEKTRIDSSFRYGCHNKRRPRHGDWVVHAIPYGGGHPYRMSEECRYDKSLTDASCSECKWRGSGEAYDAAIRAASQAPLLPK